MTSTVSKDDEKVNVNITASVMTTTELCPQELNNISDVWASTVPDRKANELSRVR